MLSKLILATVLVSVPTPSEATSALVIQLKVSKVPVSTFVFETNVPLVDSAVPTLTVLIHPKHLLVHVARASGELRMARRATTAKKTQISQPSQDSQEMLSTHTPSLSSTKVSKI